MVGIEFVMKDYEIMLANYMLIALLGLLPKVV